MFRGIACILFFCICVSFQAGEASIYRNTAGWINFVSEAPLETIEARSNALRGLIDTAANKFAFSVNINTFHGFNSPLQEEHFNENYMETKRYPTATYSGKIIETVDYSKNGQHKIRAKGELMVHGVKRERLIKATLEVRGDSITISSDFLIPLSEHNIKIPRIVHQKIAPEIKVQVGCVLKNQTIK